MKDIDKRVNRLQGQLKRVQAAIAADESCETVVPQLLAVRGAMNGVVRLYMEEALQSCARSNSDKTEQVLKLLIKHL